MDHLEAVMELKNIVDEQFKEKIIYLTEKKSDQNLGIVKDVDKNIRNVLGYSLDLERPTDIFYFNYINNLIEKLYFYYKVKFPQMVSNKLNQIDLLKYSVGCKYTVHTDHYTSSPRHLSVIINLNDDYEGGDLIFTDQKEKEIKRYKLNSGSVIFFPSNFMYPHAIEPITKGTRYSIVAWLQ
jgi:Rps23 Pro-64 3,4-dihydroxylase Tpa1-like proline 4-hydroxylase